MEEKELKKISWKNFGPEKIILIALAGVILIVTNFSDMISKKKEASTTAVKNTTTASVNNDVYVASLEQKLKDILSHVDGVGNVEVMITLKSSKESILNKDSSMEDQTEEEYAGEDSKNSYGTKRQEETILSDSDGGTGPYVVKELEPEISGIVVSCEGADKKTVTAAVAQACEVLFGVGPNHIKVLKMEVEN